MQSNTKLDKHWLALAVSALGLSGLFTILLIIGRTSNALPPEFFPPALIVHVNLDVLVWLLAMAASYFNSQKTNHTRIPFYAATIGTALIAISPFIGTGNAYENNYIPIFDNLEFKAGIAIFLGAIIFEAITINALTKDFKTKTICILLAFAFAAFAFSYGHIAENISSHYLYEYVFWGGGHIMQFAYTQLMMAMWLILATKAQIKLPSPKITNYIFAFPVVFVAVTSVLIYVTTPVESAEYIRFFRMQMVIGTGIAPLILGAILLISLIRNGAKTNLYSISLFLSMALFAIGGALGQMAAKAVAHGDITTVIPAHYHFSSVAVTVALMGYVFARLEISKTKLASWQIILYAIGQTCYFSGMAVFGGHGAARKTPGINSIQMDDHTKNMVRGIMEGGGSLSLIGGILFVVLVIKAFRKPNNLADNHQSR